PAVFNTAQLADAQVTALAHPFAAPVFTVHPQAAASLVAYVGMGSFTALHIGAATAHPQPAHSGRQGVADPPLRRDAVDIDAQQFFHFRADRDRLGVPAEHAAALGDQLGVVIGPG